MEELSLPQVAKKLEKYVMTLPAAKKFNTLSKDSKIAMMDLSDCVGSLRQNTERYFNSDDSKEQALFLNVAIEQAKLANQLILNAGQYDLLDAADVAHLSALAEDIKERLE